MSETTTKLQENTIQEENNKPERSVLFTEDLEELAKLILDEQTENLKGLYELNNKVQLLTRGVPTPENFFTGEDTLKSPYISGDTEGLVKYLLSIRQMNLWMSGLLSRLDKQPYKDINLVSEPVSQDKYGNIKKLSKYETQDITRLFLTKGLSLN